MKNIIHYNIAHIVLSLEIGGLEKVVYTMAKEQKKLGNTVIVFCLDSIGVIGQKLIEEDIEVICLNRKHAKLDLMAIRRIRRTIKLKDINIIHTHNVEANIYGMIASIFSTKIKTIHTQHGIPDNFSFTKNILLRCLGLFLNKFISVSDSAALNAVETGWISDKKIDVIINGIDIDDFVKDAHVKFNLRKKYNIPQESLVLVTVSRIEAVKDHSLLIKQFSNVISQKQAIYLVIVGDGSMKKDIENLISEMNLSKNVIMTGMQTDVKPYLQMSDIFIMTSLSEGISISLLEAMSSMLIPIVTPVGGNIQIINDGICGYFLNKKNNNSLFGIIRKVTISDDHAITLASAARKEVTDHFSKEAMLKMYMKHYESL